VRTDNSPEIIEKWKDSQKKGQVWTYLTPALEEGAEPLKLKTRSEMEAHFRKTHADTLVHETNEAWVAGNIPKQNLSPSLYHALRRGVDEARKHLLPVAQLLCSGFENQGLKLFKRRGGKLWVSRTRPKALDHTVVLSDRIGRMVEIIKGKPGISVKDLVEIVCPSTAPAPAEQQGERAPAPAEAAADSPAPAEAVAEEAAASYEAPASPAAMAATESTPPAPAPETASAAPAQHEWTTEQLHVLQDLHWLNSEGYVIEYSDGIVFIGVTEPPPPKPKAPKPVNESAPAAEAAPDVPTDEVKEQAADVPRSDEPATEPTGASELHEPVEAVEDAAAVAAHEPAAEVPISPADSTEAPAVAPFSFVDGVAPATVEESPSKS
jgi:hypothetical protein